MGDDLATTIRSDDFVTEGFVDKTVGTSIQVPAEVLETIFGSNGRTVSYIYTNVVDLFPQGFQQENR